MGSPTGLPSRVDEMQRRALANSWGAGVGSASSGRRALVGLFAKRIGVPKGQLRVRPSPALALANRNREGPATPLARSRGCDRRALGSRSTGPGLGADP